MAKKIDAVDKANAKVLADLITDQGTTDQLRVKILSKLLEAREGQSFFQTMFEEGLSFGECPCCGHMNHWGVPEDDLNIRGWVTHEKDPQVLQNTTEEDCPVYQESCKKKKVVM